MAGKKPLNLEFAKAVGHNEAQAILINEISENARSNYRMIIVINCCDWAVVFRVICDDLDSGEKPLERNEMCKISFSTSVPEETLVFCQTSAVGRMLNFDAWGGTAPRALNVWSLLPSIEYGLALNGSIRKGWNVLEPLDYDIEEEEEPEDLSEDEYYHKPVSDKGLVPQYKLDSMASSRQFTEAHVPQNPNHHNRSDSEEYLL